MSRLACIVVLLLCFPLQLFGWGFKNDGQSILDPSLKEPLRVPASRVTDFTPQHIPVDSSQLTGQAVKGPLRESSSGVRSSRPAATGSQDSGHGPPRESPSRAQSSRPVAADNQNEGQEAEGDVMEVQHATCEINTDELVATAQATATRVLKGLCNPKDIEDRFHNLETQLGEQLNVIKTMILNMEDKLGDHEQQMRRQHRRIVGAILRNGGGNCSKSASAAGTVSDLDDNEAAERYLSEVREEASLRDSEVMRLNSTIRMESGHRVFTYYWSIRDMEYKLTGWNHRRSLRSPNFYIYPGGYRMYIRVFPRQNGENVYIHVGVTKGDYDETLDWPFKLKHKVNVLDHSKNPQDLSSRLWDPTVLCSGWNWRRPVSGDNYECVGLGFPHDVIRSREYIKNDSIVIKLTVYLD